MDQGVDHPVKEVLPSAHMSAMSNPIKTLIAAAAMALILTSATGCSDGLNPVGVVVTDQEREAYEAARFQTPEGKAAAEKELARLSLSARSRPGDTSSLDVDDVLLRPKDWPVLAKGKLCEYTAALVNNADRDGNAVPAEARAAAKRILARC